MNADHQHAKSYQDLSQTYEELSKSIQELLRQAGGHTKDLPPQALQHYRRLAAQRDEVYEQMKTLEASWLNADVS
jgi:hypothetical protein